MNGRRPRIVLIAAVAENGVIGDGTDVPWHLPVDLRRFKQVTTGHPTIMGRTTFEAIGRPLPGRPAIVLTRSASWRAPEPYATEVHVAHTLDEAIAQATSMPGSERVYVIGGGQIYRAALSRADELDITEVPLRPEGDVTFPQIDTRVWQQVSRQGADGCVFVTWIRVESPTPTSRPTRLDGPPR